MRRNIEQGTSSGLSEGQRAGFQRAVDKWDAEQRQRDLEAEKHRQAQLTPAQEAETQRQIEAHLQSVNFGGTGINGDIANLGLATSTGIETTSDFADVSAAGGGMGRIAPSRRSASPANTGQYSPTVRTTPGVVVASQGLNGDIVDLGFNASATGIEPLGNGGGTYSGVGGQRRPTTTRVNGGSRGDTSMFEGDFIPIPESFSVGGAQPLGPDPLSKVFTQSDTVWVRGPDGNMIQQAQFRDVTGKPTSGYKGGPVERAQPHIQRAGAISEPPVGIQMPWAVGGQQRADLEAVREKEAATLRFISEEGDNDPTPRRLRDAIPQMGSWSNVPGAGAMGAGYDLTRGIGQQQAGELAAQRAQERKIADATAAKGDAKPTGSILNPRTAGDLGQWRARERERGFLNSGFY